MSLEELLEKYRGAYASDFEEPSASPDSSEESEGTEVEAEEETEGEDSADDSDSSSGELTFMNYCMKCPNKAHHHIFLL